MADNNGGDRGHSQEDGEAVAQRRESHGNPEDISQASRDVEESHHPALELLAERVEHGNILLLSHLLAEQKTADEEAHSIAPRSLSPSESGTHSDNSLSGSIQVASAHPRGDHGNNAHQSTEVTTRERQLNSRISLLFLRSPDTNADYNQIESDKSNDSNNVEFLNIGFESRLN